MRCSGCGRTAPESGSVELLGWDGGGIDLIGALDLVEFSLRCPECVEGSWDGDEFDVPDGQASDLEPSAELEGAP